MARIPQREFLFLLRIRRLLSFFASQSAGWGLGGILPRNSRIPQREFLKLEFLKENSLN